MADEKKYIDAMPLIAEYDKSIQWLKDNVGMLSMNQFTDQMASMQSARKMLLDAPAADVQPTEEVSDAVDEALRILNAIQSSGRLDYGDYCELHDAISAICGADMQEVGGNG